VSLTIALGTVFTAKAQLIFDNGTGAAITFDEAYFADANYTYTMAGNVFTPTASGIANHVIFDGTYANLPSTLPTDNFTLSLYATSAGAPTGSPIATSTLSGLTRTPIGVIFGSYPNLEFTGTLDNPFTLSTGTAYYLGFTDNDSPTDVFAVAASATGPSTAEFSYGGGFDGGSTDAIAFQLSSASLIAAPEPSSYAFALIILGALAFEVRRRRATEINVTDCVS
jgi:hypothetical protein